LQAGEAQEEAQAAADGRDHVVGVVDVVLPVEGLDGRGEVEVNGVILAAIAQGNRSIFAIIIALITTN